ncbi:MAG: 4Fe-4S binding protein [Candidatus Cloacimonetes bacterium]|nr:4Fe-4S binding protein [Candidatus Cloacimonadota bacterium]
MKWRHIMQRNILKGIIVFMLLAVGVFAVSADVEQTTYEGKLMKVSKIWFIQTAAAMFGLDVTALSQTYGDSLVLANGDQVKITGDMIEDVINVTTLQLGEKLYTAKIEESPAATTEIKSYQVNPKRCISCNLCVSNCPTGAISMVNGKAVIDVSKCIQCGICKNGNGQNWKGCPTGAINN